ncbi:hypothetical protein C1Y25_20515 [Pseudomonas sp. MPBC4-3]|nr:hypothetical protein C1Y25_20515 [Pseudomonas sp. MPBC4-3]
MVYLLMKTPQKLDGCPTSGAHFRVSVTYLLTDPAPSGASPLPHLDLHRSEISIGQVDLILLLLWLCSGFALALLWLLILILGAPLNHAGRTQA